MKNLMCGLIMLIVSWTVTAKQGEVKTTLAAMKSQIEQGRAITVNDRAVYSPGNEPFVLQTMQRWMKNKNSAIRLNAAMITGRLAIFTKADHPRKVALDLLFKSCEDKDAYIGALALQYLKQIRWQYFSGSHKSTIKTFLNEKQSSLEDYIHLAGYMYANEQIATIEKLIFSGSLNKKQLWQAHLASARLGRKESIDECIKTANSTPFGNEYTKIIVPSLIYTRQKACTDVLISQLKVSDKAYMNLKRNSPKNITCHCTVLEALASAIKGFPKVTVKCELVTADCKDALHKAVKWLDKHEDYKFKDEKTDFSLISNQSR